MECPILFSGPPLFISLCRRSTCVFALSVLKGLFSSDFNFTVGYDKKLKQLEQEVSAGVDPCLESNSKKIVSVRFPVSSSLPFSVT